MKVKIIKEAWYNTRHYDPDIMKDSELIIDYAGKNCPSWAEEITEKEFQNIKKNEDKEGKGNKEDKGNSEGEGNTEDKRKVNELSLVEKNALIEAAKAVGIEGNQILSWKVKTLKEKIEAKKQEEDKGNSEGEE